MIKKVEVGMFLVDANWERLVPDMTVMRVDEILSMDTEKQEMLYRGSVVTLPDLVDARQGGSRIYMVDLATASQLHFKVQEAK